MINLNSKSFQNKTLTASKGFFLKLILSVLSKKGNWGGLLKNFNKISLNSRINLNKKFLIKNNYGFVPILFNKNFVSSSRGLANRFSISFFKNLNLVAKIKSSNFLVGFNKKQESESLKTNLIFSSLKSVHSLLNLIVVFIELKNKRRGGRVFSVPVPVKSERRRRSIFVHWMKKTIKDQRKKRLNSLIVEELNGLLLKKGKSIEQLSLLEKSIRLNRVFLRKSQIKLI